MTAHEILVDLTAEERARIETAALRLGHSPEEIVQLAIGLFLGHPELPMRNGQPDWDRIIGDTMAPSYAASAITGASYEHVLE